MNKIDKEISHSEKQEFYQKWIKLLEARRNIQELITALRNASDDFFLNMEEFTGTEFKQSCRSLFKKCYEILQFLSNKFKEIGEK